MCYSILMFKFKKFHDAEYALSNRIPKCMWDCKNLYNTKKYAKYNFCAVANCATKQYFTTKKLAINDFFVIFVYRTSWYNINALNLINILLYTNSILVAQC